MKLHLNQNIKENRFSEYLGKQVRVHTAHFDLPLLMMADRLEAWTVQTISSLNEADFTALVAWQAEVILLGTGEKQIFLHPKITAPLLENGIGIEIMDSAAACRTFNILADEGRRVLAALF